MTPLGDGEAPGARRTLAILARALRYVTPFRARFAGKLGLLVLGLLPLLLLPWPVKLVIDHVIEGVPVDSPARPHPAFVRPFADALAGRSSEAVLAAAVALQLALLLLLGSFGTGGGERSAVSGDVGQGYDTATRTENEANAGFSLAGGLLGLLDFRWTLRLTQALNHHYRSRLFERIQALPMTSFDDERIGDAVYRILYDTPAITNACYRILLMPVAAPLNIALTAGVIAWVFGPQPLLVGSALAFVPVGMLATLPFAGALRRRSGVSRRAGAATTATAEEGMANIVAVQSLGAEDRQRARFDRDSWDSFTRYRALFRVGAAAFLLGALLGLAVLAQVFLGVVDGVVAGRLSRGDVVLLVTWFAQIAVSSFGLGAFWFDLQGSAAGLERVFFLMDLPAEPDPAAARELPRVRRGVRIEDASFRYPDGSRGVHGVTLDAPLGRIVALVGPAGAGKTTLAQLVPRFRVAQSGRVLVDGVDAAQVGLASLRAQIAFVFQETVLFEGTLEENIRLGRLGASDEQVRQAARLAGADEFIAQLPDGYATRLGRAGTGLSVGQKQRLAVARALVRDAPILILDEPTAALDPDSERRLVRSLREIARERVVIVIAHRLSTARVADEIVFLQAGRVVERGSHDELLARPQGAYRRFHDIQVGDAPV